MYKKIYIKNYGPFKDENMNLLNDTFPIHIIGLNDVGKTALLNAIQSPSLGLNKKYMWDNRSSIERSSIKILIKIKKKYYSTDLKNKIEKHFGKNQLFIGEWTINIETSEKEKSIKVFYSTDVIKEYFEQIILNINDDLSMNNKISIKEMTDDYLDEKIETMSEKAVKTKKDKNGIEKIQILKEIKKILYSYCYKKIPFLSADSKDHFDFIKPSYILKDTTNGSGDVIKADFEDINNFLKAFLNDDEINKFKEIIYGDYTEEDKTRNLRPFQDNIERSLSTFFEENFPSQNNIWKFAFGVGGNKIYINVWDPISNKYLSIKSTSDGVKWFLKLFIFIKSIEDYSMILIDEPEKFLHAAAQKELVKLFKELKDKKNLQVIYATHSIFMLTSDIFPSLKIITKTDEGSKIYNNINAFINSKENSIKDTLTPITASLGLNIFELEKLNNKKIYLCVEGEADINTINLSYLINKISKPENLFIIPMTGKKQ
ncbi:AAA family ATPase [Candidatus Mycoplasma mahonii]|uniref:AAA family ATPase n=1 Tax=Candidatus Mycoplasma mahonii TaxID=3004105 RepID=UPI0026ECB599|nr:AAA family ATPase [Candidatus Mycoplasma mahonii]WKX02202.1 AAA family ATPase [Candidatus Mycoplasma mahonii]